MPINLYRRRFMTVAAASAGALSFSGILRAQEQSNIGVLIPGSIADKGFMESAFNGYKATEAKLKGKLNFSLIENINYADMEQVFATLASKNQFVCAVSGASQAAMLRTAGRFPNVKFALVGGAKLAPTAPPNVSQFDMRQAEIAFVAGAAAALLTKSGTVAYIGGTEIPGIVNAGKEFGNGASFINPKIKYVQTFTGNFDDVAKAKEAGLAAAAQGADVSYHILNRGLQGLEQAAREANFKLIGGYTNRCGADPLYVGYSVTGVGHMLGAAIEQFIAGTWQPGSRPFGLAAGPQASDFTVCGAANKNLLQRLDQIKKDIVAGKINTLEG